MAVGTVTPTTCLMKQGELSIIIHPDSEVNQPQITEHTPQIVSISKLTEVASTTSELSPKEPKISELETEPATSEPTLEFATPTSNYPDSPRVRNQIT